MPEQTASPAARKGSLSPRRFLGVVLLAVVAAGAAGCQNQPRVIVSDLPTYPMPQPAVPKAPDAWKAREPVVRIPRTSRKIPDEWIPKTGRRRWRWIVIHHSATNAGSAAIFDRQHKARGWDELGYHFVINNGRGRSDGLVQVGSRWTKQKWGAHCGGTPHNAYNNYGIGICLVGDFTGRLPSEKQLDSLRKLLRFLTDRYGIEPSRVIGHRDAPNAATECPGDEMYRYLNKVLRRQLTR